MNDRACPVSGKRQYRSLKEAKRVRNIRGKDTGYLRVYECPACHYYHLTHERRKNRSNW